MPRAIDILLTDVVMPGLSGRQVAQAIQQAWGQIPVVFMSGYTDDALIRYGVDSRSRWFLQKPVTAANLLRILRLALSIDDSRTLALRHPAVDAGGGHDSIGSGS